MPSTMRNNLSTTSVQPPSPHVRKNLENTLPGTSVGPIINGSIQTRTPDDPVHREPVSAPNSLLTGKNTGKFAKLSSGGQSFSSGSSLSSGTSVGLPQESEQGIVRGRTEKIVSRSRNRLAPFPPSLYVRVGEEGGGRSAGDIARTFGVSHSTI
jgi:hypothetical protein